MKKLNLPNFLLLSAIIVFSLLSFQLSPKVTTDNYSRIKSGFVTPADTNKVWCYWYWLNDDISKEGVTKDLEAMKAAGIGAAFIGNINPPEKNGRVPLFSQEWWDIMVHAVNEGKRLGVDIGVFNCPGWSQSGGPWVKPEMTMRYLNYSETKVTGGKQISITLPKPQEIFQDVYVLAIPDRNNQYKSVELSDNQLVDISDWKASSVDINSPNTIKANTILLYPKNQLKADCDLYAWLNGDYKLIKSFLYDRSNNSVNVGPQANGPVVIALPGVESSKFRLIVKNESSKDKIAEFARVVITEEVLLEKFVEKELGKMHPNPTPDWASYVWNTQTNGTGSGISGNDVLDISSSMDKAGNLTWKAPAGKWIVIRFGMSPTGTKNSPAAPQGKGYEIDKASSKLVRYHFDNYVGKLLKRIPPESRSALKYVIADSYEMGSQNWTDGYAEKFKSGYGYDPKRFFPVLSGRIVGSVEESERFLWDLRRAVSDDVAHEYVGGLRTVSHENNLKIWLENYGHWGFPSEFLMYGGQSDLVSGEFWNEGSLGNIECKASSSAAHTYGKPITSAEAFTASGNAYGRYPALLKKRGDWSFTEGINHFVAHVYIHQPDDLRIPGVNAWFSTEFNRHNTWFSQSKVWFDYLRRCQHLLQQGKYAADVCYFIGEDAPKMTGIRNPELPSGYCYDYINAEVILNRISVKDGRFVLPDGMSYRMMVLPPQNTMRPEVLAKISQLVKEGGVILGPKPVKSPSLKGYPGCDQQIKQLAGELWGSDTTITSRPVGKGWVLTNMDMQKALGQIDVKADFIQNGQFPILWTHRTLPGMDIYFITNQGNERISFNPSFRVSDRKPQLWDAVTGKIRMLNDYRTEGGRTIVPLSMEPAQSWFVVFSDNNEGVEDEQLNSNFPGKKVLMEISGPWKVDFADKMIGPVKPVVMKPLDDLTNSSNDSIRYYSGTITYYSEIEIDKIPEDSDVYLDLGKVMVIAHVKINGSDAGGLWTSPWIISVKRYLKTGKNTIEVEVANLWRNRLIFDSRLPEKERYTSTIVADYKPDDAPPSSGLIGPVTLKTDIRE